MILRRVISHFQKQEWTAIALDFIIVVTGVFLGIQIGNWNEARGDRRDYELALDRYAEEVEQNFEILNQSDAGVKGALVRVTEGFEALRSCVDSPKNRDLIETGLIAMSGTIGISLRTSALHELTENPELLSQQSPEERRVFTETRYIFDVFKREAEYIETLPLEERMENNPVIDIGPYRERTVTYAGVDYSRPVRALKLAVPVDVACQDDALNKSFYFWERWQGVLPVVAHNIREQLDISRTVVEPENRK